MGFGDRLTRVLHRLFNKKHVKIGIYGPPNAGKTTLATRIARDWGMSI
jgi:GTPase SAR1 family protein